VIDGDSLELATGEEVRLFGIDSPERDQPYADRARAELARLVQGKTVRLEVRDRDGYGRIVARVFAGEVDVNLALVREGAAWVYRKYSKDKALLAAEENARRAKRGLWGQGEGDPVAPWEWRHGDAIQRVAPEAERPSCGAKRYCREMTSCEEARFYLVSCALTRLDGDGDGVPCEALCKGAR
jgi:endonuclease YncB( thermonuclease family)